MLIPKIDILITQVGRKVTKNLNIRINHCNKLEWESDWDKLISTGKLILPKNKLYVNLSNFDDEIDFVIPNTGESAIESLPLTNLGIRDNDNNLLFNLITDYNPDSTFTYKEPIFRIGDLITIRLMYLNPNTLEPEFTKFPLQLELVISNLTLSDQLEISLSNNGWFMKQTPMPNISINAGSNLVDTIKQGLQIMFDKFPENFQLFNFDNFLIAPDTVTFNDKLVITANQSLAQFLELLKSDYRLISYFIFNALNFSRLVEIQPEFSEAFLSDPDLQYADSLGLQVKKVYSFQTNIIDDNLEYKSKENLRLSAIVSNTFLQPNGQVTKDGNKKSKRKKISVYIEYTQKNNELLATVQDGKIIPKAILNQLDGIKILYDNNGNKVNNIPKVGDTEINGERRTLAFYQAKNTDDLIRLGLEELQKFYYDGFTGTFTTFGEPTTFVTDIIKIEDTVHPERNGDYRVKSVKTTFGLDGYRQEVGLDIKLS
jgi:hypothetical protein